MYKQNYIFFKDISKNDINEILKALEENGYRCSKYGIKRKHAIGITAYKGQNDKIYVYLNKRMLSFNSELLQILDIILEREHCKSKEEFIKKIKS